MSLRALKDGVFTNIWKDTTPLANYQPSTSGAEHPCTLTLTVVGNEYTAFFDGTKVLEVTDDDFEAPAQGSTGLESLGSEDVRFDSVKVLEE